MKDMRSIILRVTSALARRTDKKVLVGVLGYILITALYFSPVISHGLSTTFLGGPGDQTAFTWLYKASPDSPPLWGYTNWSNAPYGEDLSEPFFVTGLLLYAAVWLIAKFVGVVAAYNIIVFLGFIFTATVMYGFILWLTKKRSYFVAWFAGCLLAFSPYLLIKSMYHSSYEYVGLIVLVLWLLLLFINDPKRKKYGISLMITLAAVFYYDPYFIMLALFLGVGVLIGYVLYMWRYKKKDMRNVIDVSRRFLILSPILLILITPLIVIRLVYSQHIELVVGNSRDSDTISEARAYGARPWEYVLPSDGNPFIPQRLKDFQQSHQHGSAVTETTLFLGYTVLAFAVFYSVIFFTRKKGDFIRDTVIDHRLVYLCLAAVAVVGFIMSLSPIIKVAGINFVFPSILLFSITTMWRVLARLYLIVDIAVITIASLGMLIALRKVRARGTASALLCMAALMIAATVEYMPFDPANRPYWSYSSIPSVYDTIKNDPSIDRIAEYPMLDPPRNYAFIFYLSYQSYHHKSMINTAKTASPTKKYRESMSDLDDWQTLGALKQLGVDRVVLHGEDLIKYRTSLLTRESATVDSQTTLPVALYDLAGNVESKSYLLCIGNGFDGPSNYGFHDIDFFMHRYGELTPKLLPGGTARTSMTARIEYYAFEKTSRRVDFNQDGKVIASVMPTEQKQVVEFTVDPTKVISIAPDNPPRDYSFVISNMELQ